MNSADTPPRRFFKPGGTRIVRHALILMVGLSLLWIYRNHPYNCLAGPFPIDAAHLNEETLTAGVFRKQFVVLQGDSFEPTGIKQQIVHRQRGVITGSTQRPLFLMRLGARYLLVLRENDSRQTPEVRGYLSAFQAGGETPFVGMLAKIVGPEKTGRLQPYFIEESINRHLFPTLLLGLAACLTVFAGTGLVRGLRAVAGPPPHGAPRGPLDGDEAVLPGSTPAGGFRAEPANGSGLVLPEPGRVGTVSPGSRRVLIALIGFWTVFRFYGLAASPYGFSDDESSGAMHFICQAETGANGLGRRWPLFTNQYESPWQEKLSAGIIPPTYYYIGSGWVKVFGGSIFSIRAMNNVAVLIFILFLYLFTARVAGSGPALYAALAASLSPWLFQFGRLGTMAAWGLAFLAPACYFFLRSNTVRDQAFAGALLALMACTYPPLCLYAPFLLLLLLYLKLSVQGERLPWRAIGGLLAGGGLLSLPLLFHLSSAEGRARAGNLSIFSDHYTRQFEGVQDYLKFAGETFLGNIARHFSPEYLLVSGDANLCHSTQYFGEWGWLEAFAIIGALCCLVLARLGKLRLPRFSARGGRYFTGLLIFCLLGYLCGIIPAASTTEGVPHALRSLGALPFLFMAAGLLVWWELRIWNKTAPLLMVIALAYTACFPLVYFSIYPGLSESSWGGDLRRNAEYGRQTGDWKPFGESTGHSPRLSARYFLIQYAGENVLSSEARLDAILNQRERPSAP